jgi:hypothetical protein
MLLRDHPLMMYHRVRSWPPVWTLTGSENKHAKGEIGILKKVIRSYIKPYDRCYLIMEHCGAEYGGVLLLSDPAFCREIYRVLIQHCGKTIREIGDIDLSYTL